MYGACFPVDCNSSDIIEIMDEILIIIRKSNVTESGEKLPTRRLQIRLLYRLFFSRFMFNCGFNHRRNYRGPNLQFWHLPPKAEPVLGVPFCAGNCETR